jgi:hypothetical protein
MPTDIMCAKVKKNVAYKLKADQTLEYMHICAFLCQLPSINAFYIISDVDECSQSPSVCHQYAKCTNTVGYFSCQCNQGFLGDGIQNCAGTKNCSGQLL